MSELFILQLPKIRLLTKLKYSSRMFSKYILCSKQSQVDYLQIVIYYW